VRVNLCWIGIVATILSLFCTGYAEEKNEIGLGLVLGEPTGVNAQFFWSERTAIDVTVAWSWKDWLFTSVDYQIYDYILDSPREWRWYYGLGAYIALPENEHGRLGVRIPVGLKYHFPHSAIDVWAEAAPALRLIDKTKPDLQGGLGITFWLK
jgi:hypothetical protein